MDVSFTVRSKAISSARVRDVVKAALASERVRDALVSVAFIGERAIAKLNKDFLSHDGPTDVVSFGLSRTNRKSPVIGDIYICPSIAARNARRLRVSTREELDRLIVHGILHVLGYDHPEGAARTKSPMWKRQERILAGKR